MITGFPETPAHVMPLTSGFRFLLSIFIPLAKLLGFWKRPLKRTATDNPEMSWWDKIYWCYKCKYPILQSEKKTDISQMVRDPRILKLPQDFKVTQTLSFSAVGDLFYEENLHASKDVLYQNVADIIFDADISYGNLEAPLIDTTPPEMKPVDIEPPVTLCPPDKFDILKGHKGKKFDVLNLANNHIYDFGNDGLHKTQTLLEKENILDIGVNKLPQDYGEAKTIEKNGIKIGLPTVTFGTNGKQLAPDDKFRLNVSKISSKFCEPDLNLAKQQIDHCKSQGCDFIMLTLHWGYEFEFFPREEQIAAARELVEYGADSIICHHTHVIQPVEYYQTKRDPERIAVIAYSLGSLAWTFQAPHLTLSLILNLQLSTGTNKGKTVTYIEDASAIPVLRHYFEKEGCIFTQLEKLEATHDESIADLSDTLIQNYKNLVLLTLGHHTKTESRENRNYSAKAA